MRDLWDRLESYLRASAPHVLDTLNPPATDKQIADAQRKLGVELPRDLVASLRIHNGQRAKDPHPLVPSEYDKTGSVLATWGELLSLDQIVAGTAHERQYIAHMSPDARSFIYKGPVRRDGKWNWIPILDPGTAHRIALDLEPATRGQRGQVISILSGPEALIVLAPSYREWFELLVERFEAGRYLFAEQDGHLSPMDRFNIDFEEPWDDEE